MSPRRNHDRRGSRSGGDRGAADRSTAESVERDQSDGEWTVRQVSGSAAVKPYRCPGCDQLIPAGMPHVVAWPSDGGMLGLGGPDDRRHWHRGCWRARGRRGVDVQRSRNAPRYG